MSDKNRQVTRSSYLLFNYNFNVILIRNNELGVFRGKYLRKSLFYNRNITKNNILINIPEQLKGFGTIEKWTKIFRNCN